MDASSNGGSGLGEVVLRYCRGEIHGREDVIVEEGEVEKHLCLREDTLAECMKTTKVCIVAFSI